MVREWRGVKVKGRWWRCSVRGRDVAEIGDWDKADNDDNSIFFIYIKCFIWVTFFVTVSDNLSRYSFQSCQGGADVRNT